MPQSSLRLPAKAGAVSIT